MLGYAGYELINLKPLAKYPLLEKLRSRFSRIKPTEIILFYYQLALLLETGMNIVSSLEILEEQASNRVLKKVLGDVIADLRDGNQLSVALHRHPDVFPPVHCQSLKVGEQTGNLETMLRQISEYMEKETKSANSVRNAMVYPIIVIFITVIVVGIMVTSILPAFNKLYASFGTELPLLTRIVINAGEILQKFGIYLLLAIMVVGGLVYAYIKTPGGRYNWDKLSLTFPLLGLVNHMNELARLSRSMSLLYYAGLPLTEILPLVIEGSGNKVMAEALTDVCKNMISGEGLSRPMAKSEFFLPMMVQMVKVGEETGSLDNTLLSVAKSYEAEAEDKLRSLIGLIQPVMMIMVSVIVGIIALSLVSAMYSIYGQII